MLRRECHLVYFLVGLDYLRAESSWLLIQSLSEVISLVLLDDLAHAFAIVNLEQALDDGKLDVVDYVVLVKDNLYNLGPVAKV